MKASLFDFPFDFKFFFEKQAKNKTNTDIATRGVLKRKSAHSHTRFTSCVCGEGSRIGSQRMPLPAAHKPHRQNARQKKLAIFRRLEIMRK